MEKVGWVSCGFIPHINVYGGFLLHQLSNYILRHTFSSTQNFEVHEVSKQISPNNIPVCHAVHSGRENMQKVLTWFQLIGTV